MIKIRILALALALGGAFAASAAQAAPDTTQGVAILAAHVAANGTLLDGSGATGAGGTGTTGDYEVDFNRDVTNCFYNAVSHDPTFPYALEPRSGAANGVFLAFTNLGSTSANPTRVNSEFYLTVFCIR